MTAWIAVIFTGIGILITLIKALVESSKRSERILINIENMQTNFEKFFKNNNDTHDRIWKNLDEHEEKLVGHEMRITIIEKEKGNR